MLLSIVVCHTMIAYLSFPPSPKFVTDDNNLLIILLLSASSRLVIVYNQFVLPYLLFFARESLAQAYATMVPHAHMKGRVGGALIQFSGTMKGVTLIPTPTHTFTHYNTFFLDDNKGLWESYCR